jgi:GntR family transcriptional regulator
MSEISYRSPFYLQLREVLRTKIEEGEYLPGMAIPSENELADLYRINRLTVRNATDALVKEGVLKRVPGKGVYLCGKKMERDLDYLAGFTQTMTEHKVKPSTKVITKVLRKAGDKYSLMFNIFVTDDIYYIKRICYADELPLSLEEIYVPKYIVPKLDGIDLSVFSLYEIYGFYGVHLEYAQQTLDLVHLEQKDARMLNIGGEDPVFLFECTTYSKEKRVIEFAKTFTRSDKCNFSVSFGK